jgi:4-hydroxy-3-polyprenylbenzoate decarboxylase
LPADPLEDLRGFLQWLESKGLLKRIHEQLSPVLEIPCFLRRVMYDRGPSILFENVRGYPSWRIAGNIFSSQKIFAEAHGVQDSIELGERFTNLFRAQSTQGIGIRTLTKIRDTYSMLPKKVNKAGFTENSVEAEKNPLNMIPAFKTWPKDGGRYLTYPLVVTLDPETGVSNIGVYRVMIKDGVKGVIHWQIHKRGAKSYNTSLQEKIPVAIVIGSDLTTLFTGAAPVPLPIDKYLFAGIIRGRGTRVYQLDNGILVPANAEVVLEGYVRKGELSEEGPFGDHFGYYDKPVEKYPVFHVERMYYRDDPIYYGTTVGMPPLEDSVIGKLVERIFLPLLKTIVPEIVDIDFPVYAGFQGMVFVSIKKRYPGQAKKVMNALWGIGQTSLTKIIVVVDHDIDVHDYNKVLWAVSTNVLPHRDVVVMPFTHTDALDPATTASSYGGKIGIDATRKLPEENFGKKWPETVEEDPMVLEKINSIYESMKDNVFR